MTDFYPLPKFDTSLYNQTLFDPLGLLVVLILGLATLLVPRRWAALPVLLTLCFVSMRQRIAVFELDFGVVRILVLFGWVRLLARGETARMRWIPLDTAVAGFGIFSAIAYVLRKGAFGAVIYQSGTLFDLYGIYFMFRNMLGGWRDIERIVTALMWISIPTAVLFGIEYWTGRNPFYALGGVAEFTTIREGRVRSSGVFSHPILAGCFWAALAPRFGAAWWRDHGAQRALVPVSLIAVTAIVYFTASSTPIMLLTTAVVGSLAWPLRGYMREVRWTILAVTIGLHLVMKGPVWHLIARLDVVGGSTGYHRYSLINQAINHFGDWFLLGTDRTYQWGWGMGDVTNHYLYVGAQSGFFAMALLLLLLVLAFQRVGRLRRVVAPKLRYVVLCWALGVALFTNLVGFMAVAYTSQLMVMWHLLLALIAAPAMSPQPIRRRVPAPRPLEAY